MNQTIEYFMMAADQSNATDQYIQGDICQQGYGVIKNLKVLTRTEENPAASSAILLPSNIRTREKTLAIQPEDETPQPLYEPGMKYLCNTGLLPNRRHIKEKIRLKDCGFC